MSDLNVDKALDVLADYADLVWDATDLQDKDTMAVARTQQELFESRVWVDEWLEQKPPAARSSNRFDPASRNRFAQWLAWKQDQRGRRAYMSSRVYQFADAAQIEALISTTVEIRTERTIRPLAWLKKYDYLDRAPEVMALAIEKAGSADKVTGTIVREALNDYKRERLVISNPSSLPKSVKARVSAALIKARRDRQKLQTTFDEMWHLASTSEEARAELQAALTYISDKVKGQAQ